MSSPSRNYHREQYRPQSESAPRYHPRPPQGYERRRPPQRPTQLWRRLGLAATYAITSVAGVKAIENAPAMESWLLHLFGHETKTVNVGPSVGMVNHYAALVTGTITSSFPVRGDYHSFGCQQTVSPTYEAVATVKSKVGDFSVATSPDGKKVTMTLSKQPVIKSGLRLNDFHTNLGVDALFKCDIADTITLVKDVTEVAQAAGQTLAACAVKRPDFEQSYEDQIKQFGVTTHAKGTEVIVVPPPASNEPDPSIAALEQAKAHVHSDGFSVASTAVDNCVFDKFTMQPIVLNIGPAS